MVLLSQSLWRKVVATAIAVSAFVLLYDAAVIDSKRVADGPLATGSAVPQAGARLKFVATAYCKGQTTASGVGVTTGIVAADKDLLPEGSVIQLDSPSGRDAGLPDKYRGIYTVMDTGPLVNGRHIDIYLWNCNEALSFGRRDTVITVLRLGWNPKNSRPE